MRRVLTVILLASLLGAQGRPPEILHGELGVDPLATLCLAPPGCWDALLLGTAIRPQAPRRHGTPGATVEVWDTLLPLAPRQESFLAALERLRARLAQGLALPPPSHGKIELSELMGNDPTQPQKLDLTRVKSMQERYNRLPPNGATPRPRP